MEHNQETNSGETEITRPRNSKIFAILLLLLQIFCIVMFAIFVRPQGYTTIVDNGLVQSVGVALFVLIGFGLYFSYMKNYSWSGLGFTLLIAAITLQFYVIVNAFWSKANLQVADTDWGKTYISLYLSDQNGNTSASGTDTLGNTIVGGFKCALAMVITFSAIGGRGGPLEAIIIVIIGTITYELNRQILILFSVNQGGSTTVFEFGGVAGSLIAILLSLTKQKGLINSHPEFISNKQNATLAVLGSAFIWVFFPYFNMDIPVSLFIYSNAGISTMFCVCACVATMIGISLVIDGKLYFRDIITAPIAGGVIVGSSSTYIFNPMESIMFGIMAAIVQIIFNRVEAKTAKNPLWSNGVLSLFVIQGLLGGLFSAVLRAINKTVDNYGPAYESLPSKFVYNQGGQISATFITLGIAAITGLVIFLVIMCLTNMSRGQLYHDQAYWHIHEDDISNKRQQSPQKSDHVEVHFGDGVKDFEGEYL